MSPGREPLRGRAAWGDPLLRGVTLFFRWILTGREQRTVGAEEAGLKP